MVYKYMNKKVAKRRRNHVQKKIKQICSKIKRQVKFSKKKHACTDDDDKVVVLPLLQEVIHRVLPLLWEAQEGTRPIPFFSSKSIVGLVWRCGLCVLDKRSRQKVNLAVLGPGIN